MANERNITWSVLLLQALEGVGWTTACFCVTTHLMYYNAFHYQIQNLPEGSEKMYNKLKQQLTNFCVVCLGVLFKMSFLFLTFVQSSVLLHFTVKQMAVKINEATGYNLFCYYIY